MVRRYDHFASEQFNCYSFMEEVIDGDYVTYDDYQKLKASHDELVEIITRIMTKLEYGDIYQWDDGDPIWDKAREVTE